MDNVPCQSLCPRDTGNHLVKTLLWAPLSRLQQMPAQSFLPTLLSSLSFQQEQAPGIDHIKQCTVNQRV
jgi:hypothetical protein